jgi:amino acid transporter
MGDKGDDPQQPGTGEGPKQRVDRELIELLNELRVALPGVQILFGFLLIVPFNQGFAKLSSLERWIYFVAFVTTALGTALLIAPSSYHRLRFRQRDKERMLFTSNRMAIGGMALVALSTACIAGLITEVVLGGWAAIVVVIAIAVWFGWFWYGQPLTRRLRTGVRTARSALPTLGTLRRLRRRLPTDANACIHWE